MGFIDDLYNGSINPKDNWYQPTEEYLKDSRTITKCEEELYQILSSEALSLFKTFSTVTDNINYIHNLESFRTGFRLGAQMMIDVLKPDDDSE